MPGETRPDANSAPRTKRWEPTFRVGQWFRHFQNVASRSLVPNLVTNQSASTAAMRNNEVIRMSVSSTSYFDLKSATITNTSWVHHRRAHPIRRV